MKTYKLKSGIYCYTNLINEKRYVGQSRNLKARKKAHNSKPFYPKGQQYNSPFYRAVRKYGIDNFNYEVLEYCLAEQLNEKEIFWINHYKTIDSDFGYNLSKGGSKPHFIKLNQKLLEEIRFLLEKTFLTNGEIGKMCGELSDQTISDINTGRAWFCEGLKYPIRQHQPQVVGKLKNMEKSFCSLCGNIISPNTKTGMCKSCYNENRPGVLLPSKIELVKMILDDGFEATGRRFKVSGNGIKKRCTSMGLPKLKHELAVWYEKNYRAPL